MKRLALKILSTGVIRMDLTLICELFGILFILAKLIPAGIAKYKDAVHSEITDVENRASLATHYKLDATQENFTLCELIQADMVVYEMNRNEGNADQPLC
jgi:hypothetical protein